jgi:hypothetical protein
MTVARSGADVLEEHLVFEAERIDRMSCNAYVPQSRLNLGPAAHGFLHDQFGGFGCDAAHLVDEGV